MMQAQAEDIEDNEAQFAMAVRVVPTPARARISGSLAAEFARFFEPIKKAALVLSAAACLSDDMRDHIDKQAFLVFPACMFLKNVFDKATRRPRDPLGDPLLVDAAIAAYGVGQVVDVMRAGQPMAASAPLTAAFIAGSIASVSALAHGVARIVAQGRTAPPVDRLDRSPYLGTP